MAGNRNTDFTSGRLLNAVRDLIGNRRILIVCHFLFVFFFGEFGILFGDSALCNCDDRETAAALVSGLNCIDNLIDVIGDLGKKDDVCAACDAGIQRKPANLMTHDLNDEDAAVGRSSGVDIINALGGDIQSAVESKCHIGSIEVVVYGLRQSDDVQPLFTQKISRLCRAIAAAHNQAVKLQLMISLFHCLNLIQTILIGIADGLEGASAGTEHGAATGQDTFEIPAVKNAEFAVDQALIAVLKSVKFNRLF